MNLTWSTVKENIRGMVHGSTLDKITNLNQLAERAGNNVLSKIDPEPTRRVTQITNAIHDEIYEYTAPSDLKGDKVIDIRPQVSRELWENFSGVVRPEQFDLRKELEAGETTLHVRMEDGTKKLWLSKSITPSPTSIHNMNDDTANGTWSVGNDAENLTVDKTIKADDTASLNFDLDGSTTDGFIENSDMDKVDLSDEEDIAQLFLRGYFPDSSIITSINLRWGSSSSDYWDVTSSSPFDSSSFEDGWNLISFDWDGASSTGSPDSSEVDYVRITVNYDGTAETDIRMDKLTVSIGAIHDIEYYSNHFFRSSGGTYKAQPSDDMDIVNIDSGFKNIFLYEMLKEISQQLQGEDSTFDFQFSETRLQRLYRRFNRNVPSKEIKPTQHYYRI